jgi:alkanesulfonate monooxygenase SsuD/methylene tetrahydromethanopterin reductase-like flavin-dependent oxidoreductase (luciferase family)
MKFGIFMNAQQPRSDDPVRRFREAVAQARLAREAGFDALAAGHHYLSPPYQSLQSLPFLARLAGEVPGMELCLSVLLLALLNPVQTAERRLRKTGFAAFWTGRTRPPVMGWC